jgi:hypothetical protein
MVGRSNDEKDQSGTKKKKSTRLTMRVQQIGIDVGEQALIFIGAQSHIVVHRSLDKGAENLVAQGQ